MNAPRNIPKPKEISYKKPESESELMDLHLKHLKKEKENTINQIKQHIDQIKTLREKLKEIKGAYKLTKLLKKKASREIVVHYDNKEDKDK